jgi:hypothetical protein
MMPAALAATVVAMAWAASAGPAAAGDDELFPTAGEAWEVERVDAETPKAPTLRFLDENRAFFRARLDELRLLLRADWSGDARELDPRWLAWREMLDQIRAAQDTSAVSREWIRRRALLESVGDLVQLELEMDEMERLLDEQQGRLTQLEEDFTGRQRTAVVVLLRGVPATGAPATVVLREADGPARRVALDGRVQGALARGGSAELLHRLVEPREQRWELSFEGEGWSGAESWELVLDPERDRMTFLEIDVSSLRPDGAEARPVTRQWVR